MVEGFDIVHFARGNVDKTRDVAAQVDQGMQLDGALAAAKTRPREQRQAEIDGRGIEGVDCLFEVDTQGFARIELPGPSNEDGREIAVDAPVAFLIGLGQRVAGDRAANACVVQLGLQRVQTDFDVAQAGPVGQLSKGHAEKLIEAGKPARPIVASILVNAAVEIAPRQERHELRDEILPGVHRQVLSTVWRGKDYRDPADPVEIDAGRNPS